MHVKMKIHGSISFHSAFQYADHCPPEWNRVKFLHITAEPKPISAGIVGTKGRLSPATEKFWQCAKEAALRD